MSNDKRRIDGLNIEVAGDADGLNKALQDINVSQKLKSLTLIDKRIAKNEDIVEEHIPLIKRIVNLKVDVIRYEKVIAEAQKQIEIDSGLAIDIVDSLNNEYIFLTLNDIYAIGRYDDDRKNPEFEARCKDCGKLLYKFDDSKLTGVFVVEAHCNKCKKLLKTKFGREI